MCVEIFKKGWEFHVQKAGWFSFLHVAHRAFYMLMYSVNLLEEGEYSAFLKLI